MDGALVDERCIKKRERNWENQKMRGEIGPKRALRGSKRIREIRRLISVITYYVVIDCFIL